MIQPAPKNRQPAPCTVFLAVVVASLALTTQPAIAQDADESNFERAARLIAEGTRELIETEIEMSEREAARFWPVYERYDQEMDLLGAQYVRLLETYYDNYLRGVLDDNAADRLTDEYLALQIGILRVRQKYVGEFRKVIGSMRTAKLYQLQNKVRAEVDAALAEVVPLIETTP